MDIRVGIGVVGGFIDAVAPTRTGIEVGTLADNRIVITCSEPLDTGSVPATGDFAIAGISLSISSVSVQGSTVWLILNDNVPDNYTLTLSYTAGSNPIRDLAHNNLANFSTQAVTNNASNTSAVNLSIAFVATQFVFKWMAPAGNDISFHEGDGTTQTVSGADGSLRTTTTSYSGAGTFDVWLTGDWSALTYIDINGQAFVSGTWTTWYTFTGLTVLDVSSTGTDGNVEGFAARTALLSLRADSTTATGNAALLSALTSATDILLQNTSVTFDTTPAWSMTGTITFQNNSWTSTMVDNALAAFAATPVTGCTINVAANNAARTAASDADKAIIVDPPNTNTLTVNE